MNPTITASGNITRDPELKFSNDGKARVRFGIANTRKVNDRETTSFFDVIAFGKMAENVHASLFKGANVLVSGRAEVREYERNDGSKGFVTEIIADEVGANLRFATVTVSKNPKANSSNSEWEIPEDAF